MRFLTLMMIVISVLAWAVPSIGQEDQPNSFCYLQAESQSLKGQVCGARQLMHGPMV
jgi:hypothetical protein